MNPAPLLLVSCEHGGNRIPAAWRHFFAGQAAMLDSHRGFDAGALQLARAMAHTMTHDLDAALVASTTSRLLIDLNRSPHHRHLYSEIMRPADAATRAAIFRRHYLPYRRRIERIVQDAVTAGRKVLHISCHSFTPVLDGEPRRADIGLLYDPARTVEARFCHAWKIQLALCAPQLAIRLNYPYRGNADGLTTHLRRLHAGNRYRGIEIEINQALVGADGWTGLQATVITALRRTVAEEIGISDSGDRCATDSQRGRRRRAAQPGRRAGASLP